MQYLAVVLHGSADEKALMSFNFLDIRRQKKLLYQDFEQLMFDICIFWNIVTGGKGTQNNNIWKSFLKKRKYKRYGSYWPTLTMN